VLTSVIFLSNKANLGAEGGTPTPASNQAKQSSPSATDLTGTQFIQLFFQVINQKQTNTAVSMLNSSLLPNQEAANLWASQLGSFQSILVKDISEVPDFVKTPASEKYKVILTAQTSPDAANAPIPFYGWSDGDNIRFITIIKGEDGLWRVQEIATGP